MPALISACTLPQYSKYRTARLADQDRFWIAVGGSYAFNNWISADLGYTPIFMRDADINENVTTGPVTHQLNGQKHHVGDRRMRRMPRRCSRRVALLKQAGRFFEDRVRFPT